MACAELHFHLLPGLDDGPASLEESVELAAAAVAEGTGTIVATPHIHRQHVRDVSILPERVAELRARLRREGIPIEVRCGGELASKMVWRLSDAELEVIAQGPRGRQWLLLEASLGGLDEAFTAAAEDLRSRGFAVVMAHPERAHLERGGAWSVLERELAAGTAMQVNAWSVIGHYGDRVRRDALAVLRRAPMAVVASDAHGGERMPALSLACRALVHAGDAQPARRVSEFAQRLLSEGLAAAPALAA